MPSASIGASMIYETMAPLPFPIEPGQGLAATRQRAFERGLTDFDMGDNVAGPVGEPGTAAIAFADCVLVSRCLQHGARQPACRCQVPPGWRARARPATPSLPERTVRVPPLLHPYRRGKAWHDADDVAQVPAHPTQVQARVEVLHEVEYVFGGALGVAPAAHIVIDDQDRAVAAAVFERASPTSGRPGVGGTVAAVDRNAGREAVAKDGARDHDARAAGRSGAFGESGTRIVGFVSRPMPPVAEEAAKSCRRNASGTISSDPPSV